MSDSSTRLGTLAGQWEVPDPDELKMRLQPEPDVEQRFYESSLLSTERNSSEERPASEHGGSEGQCAAKAAFEIFRDESGDFRWRLQTEQGSVLANSGSPYSSRAACRRAIDQVRALSSEASVKERP